LKLIRLLIAALLLAWGHAHAAYTVYMYQSGADVVATGSGSLNLTGLVFGGAGAAAPRVQPNVGALVIGLTAAAQGFDGIAGPAVTGAGGSTAVSSSTGDKVGVAPAINRLIVPNGYVSGAPLASSATWVGTTIAGLGLTPGTYTWTWAGDSFVLNVGMAPPLPAVAQVPTVSEWGMAVLSVALAVFGLRRMRRSSSRARSGIHGGVK
jgi:hypothetical protein